MALLTRNGEDIGKNFFRARTGLLNPLRPDALNRNVSQALVVFIGRE